mgnify:CR=1 FL=1
MSDRSYTYDDAGNITSIADTPQDGETDIQCFRQDILGRLSTAWTPKSGVSCETDPAVANLGGPAPYWHDWTFDSTGSRLTETSHTADGDTTRTYTVPTGGQGVVRPHAVTEMTTTAPGQPAVVSKYAYDETGNTTCRPSGSTANDCVTKDGSQTLTWDAEGRLATVSTADQTIETNVYDVDGTRLIRRDATGTTLFLPGQEIRREGGVNTGTRYYSFAGTICASRTGGSAAANLTWLYPDHQGTQQLAINASTQAVTIRRQTPYGDARGENPIWVNSKGFVGGDNDPSGLVNIGARRYDKILGRFISVDPVLDLSDPQQWNPYVYSYNSPITNSDPTGLRPECGGGTGFYICSSGVPKANPKVNKGNWPDTKSRNTAVSDAEAARRVASALAERRKRECQASFWCRNGEKIRKAGGAVKDFAVEHADVIGAVTGVVVGLGCTVLTGGSGAVLCGALGGAVTGLVSSGLKCAGGDEGHCNGGLVKNVLISAGLGALGGFGGAAVGGLLKAGLRGAASAASAAVRGTPGAMRQILPASASKALGGSARQSLGATARSIRRHWSADVAEKGGGLRGRFEVLAETGDMISKGAMKAEGIGAGAVAAFAPTTKDDLTDLIKNGPSFHPVKTPVQVIGAMLGGAFP